ncbi:phage tail protein [Dyadobacter tibetensis]|uniref:phage tail protein n=1 Tax=Dyadobacter tibetensis TaxID=1211851 RepID=UPI0004705396|nr:tail fiber protein [Dyadobacter tibetensis]
MTKPFITFAFSLGALLLNMGHLKAQSSQFIGEIRMFAGDFAPSGWELCNGQLLSISSNQALFSLIGTFYGGDGETTFALPDFRGRVPIHAGNGPGLSQYRLGQKGGAEQVTLTNNNLPTHSHTATIKMGVSDQPGNTSNPIGSILANSGAFDKEYTDQDTTGTLGTTSVTVSPTHPSPSGNTVPVNLIQPYNQVNYIIALIGIYPSAN